MTSPGYGIRPPAHRLPDATRVGQVRLQVTDLARSLDFYERVLGLRAVRRDATSASLGPHDGGTVLVELRERAGRPVPPRGRLGLFHFAILLPERGALGRFLGHLASLGVAPGMSDHAVSEALYLSDPDGLGIEVYADRPRDAWRTRGRELFMTTAPLGVADLLQAAGDASWSGMPAGTTIGHVHLHVGDLARGAAFYHAALGLDQVVWSYPGALFLAAGGYHHHLGTNVWAAGARAPEADEAQLREWELVVPTAADVDAAARSLENTGHPVERHGADALAADPWGTRVRVRSEG